MDYDMGDNSKIIFKFEVKQKFLLNMWNVCCKI